MKKWMVPKWGCDRQAYRRYACLSAKARDCRWLRHDTIEKIDKNYKMLVILSDKSKNGK